MDLICGVLSDGLCGYSNLYKCDFGRVYISIGMELPSYKCSYRKAWRRPAVRY